MNFGEMYEVLTMILFDIDFCRLSFVEIILPCSLLASNTKISGKFQCGTKNWQEKNLANFFANWPNILIHF